MRKRRPRSCGLRRCKASRANRIWPTWRQRIASYRLSRSSAQLGKLARRKKQRARSAVGSTGSGPVRARFPFRLRCPAVPDRSRLRQPERSAAGLITAKGAFMQLRPNRSSPTTAPRHEHRIPSALLPASWRSRRLGYPGCQLTSDRRHIQ
jgi:hypothetical protein